MAERYGGINILRLVVVVGVLHVAALWQTLVRSEAVRSRCSLCLIVGKPPFGQIIARFAEKAEPQ